MRSRIRSGDSTGVKFSPGEMEMEILMVSDTQNLFESFRPWFRQNGNSIKVQYVISVLFIPLIGNFYPLRFFFILFFFNIFKIYFPGKCGRS